MSAPTSIERIEIDELVCWRLQGPAGELIVAEQGAQILSYQEWAQPPLLWQSREAAHKTGLSLRGGVPICWPWFGDLKRNPIDIQNQHQAPSEAPAHGLVRTLPWQLLDLEDAGDEVRLSLGFFSDGQLPNWPYQAELELHIRLGARLSITLTTRNTGATELSVSQALHSYFAVSDIHKVKVEGLNGLTYLDTLDNWLKHKQKGALSFVGETDRIYLDVPKRLSITDTLWQRRIVLETEGSDSCVVWNPWIDKAKRLTQFAANDWQNMLCIESANVLEDALVMAPEAEHSLTLTLWSEPLSQ